MDVFVMTALSFGTTLSTIVLANTCLGIATFCLCLASRKFLIIAHAVVFTWTMDRILYAKNLDDHWLFRHCLIGFTGFTIGVISADVYKSTYYNGAETKGSWSSRRFRTCRVWRLLHWYFAFTFRPSPTPRDETSRLICVHPHGPALPIGPTLAYAIPGTRRSVSAKLPLIAINSLVFRIPIIREIALLAGGVEATHDTMTSLLSRGFDVVVLPGGIKEMVAGLSGNFGPDLTHKGFLTVAAAAGAVIIPAWSHGEYDVYISFAGPKPIRAIRRWCSRRFKYPFPLSAIPVPIPAEIDLVEGEVLSNPSEDYDAAIRKLMN